MRPMRAVAAVLAATSAMALASPAAAATTAEDERVLVVSVPGLTWADVQEYDLPNIEAFLEDAGLANLAPRAVRRATPGAAYLTISAGARATSNPFVDGQQLAVDEESGGSTAGEVFQRRTGTQPDGEFVSLAWPTLVATNDRQPYGARLGLLAETLTESGFGAVAVGNADGADSAGTSIERQVGLAVAMSDGVLADGGLSDDLLASEPSHPFGQRLDLDELVTRFESAWESPGGRPGGVVLVEASDLARTMRYDDSVSDDRYQELWAQALADTDELVGALMARVDADQDTVLLMAPYNLPGDRDLTVAGLRTPGSEPGYLQSASTQRAGFLTLVDIAPTLLDRLGLDRPVAMEGRAAEFVGSDEPLDSRVDQLVTLNDESSFRVHLLFPTTLVMVILLAAVSAAAVVVIVRGGWPRARQVVVFAALTLVAMFPMSYLARVFPIQDQGPVFYWAVLIAGALALTGLVTAGSVVAARRRAARPRLAIVGMLVLVLAVPLLDVMTGSNLSLGAAFGYSAPDNSRLYGIGNYTFGQVVGASCLLAGMLASTSPARRGRLWAIGLLVATLVVIGAPTWGADVGGTLAFTPAVLLFAVLAYQGRIRLRTVVLAGVGTLVAVMAFGFLDLARPPGQRAHLGRLLERVGDEGVEPLLDIVERKALAMVGVTTSSFWLAAIPVAIAFIVFLARHPDRPLTTVRRRIPMLQIGLVTAYVAAVLGTLMNDSGAIIAGVTVTVLAASLAALALETERPTNEQLDDRRVVVAASDRVE